MSINFKVGSPFSSLFFFFLSFVPFFLFPPSLIHFFLLSLLPSFCALFLLYETVMHFKKYIKLYHIFLWTSSLNSFLWNKTFINISFLYLQSYFFPFFLVILVFQYHRNSSEYTDDQSLSLLIIISCYPCCLSPPY